MFFKKTIKPIKVLVKLLLILAVSSSIVLFIQNQDLKSSESELSQKLKQNEKKKQDFITNKEDITTTIKINPTSILTTPKIETQVDDEPVQTTKPNINIFDLNQNLEPTLVYSHIKCRKSAKIANTQTTLCVHNIVNDVHVSGSIWSTGVWEQQILSKI